MWLFQIGQKEIKLSSVTSILAQYNESLKNIHDTVTVELLDNKHVEYLTKMFNMKKDSARRQSAAVLESEDKDEAYLCPHGNEEVEGVKPDEFREDAGDQVQIAV